MKSEMDYVNQTKSKPIFDLDLTFDRQAYDWCHSNFFHFILKTFFSFFQC